MTNKSQVDTSNLREIEIEKLNELSRENLNDWLEVIWSIFEQLQDKNEGEK